MTKQDLIFKEIDHNSSHYWRAVDLRDIVLRKPLNMAFTKKELLAEDNQHHLAAFKKDLIVGVLSMLPINSHTVKMRQVAVLPNCQRQGIGQRLVEFSESWAKGESFEEIVLHARKEASLFYLRNNYAIVGDPFIEVNLPHYKMKKRL